MSTHTIASRDEWLEARRDLLAAERDLTRRSDNAARLRQQLPWVRVDKEYTFDGPDGRQRLADLFEDAASFWFSTSYSRRALSRVARAAHTWPTTPTA